MCKVSGDPREDDLAQPGGAGVLPEGGDTNRTLKVKEKLAQLFKMKRKRGITRVKNMRKSMQMRNDKMVIPSLGMEQVHVAWGCVPLQEPGISGLWPTGSQFPNSPKPLLVPSPVHFFKYFLPLKTSANIPAEHAISV